MKTSTVKIRRDNQKINRHLRKAEIELGKSRPKLAKVYKRHKRALKLLKKTWKRVQKRSKGLDERQNRKGRGTHIKQRKYELVQVRGRHVKKYGVRNNIYKVKFLQTDDNSGNTTNFNTLLQELDNLFSSLIRRVKKEGNLKDNDLKRILINSPELDNPISTKLLPTKEHSSIKSFAITPANENGREL